MSAVIPILYVPTLAERLKALEVIYDAGLTWNGRSRVNAMGTAKVIPSHEPDQSHFYCATSGVICLGDGHCGSNPTTRCNSARHFVAYIKTHFPS